MSTNEVFFGVRVITDKGNVALCIAPGKKTVEPQLAVCNTKGVPAKTRKTRIAATHRFRPEVLAIVKKLSRRERITQVRFLEECVIRQAEAVAANPFPMRAA